MPRGRKPMVDLKIRREWLRLLEEEGWTPTQIAEQANYDVRTVRNYLRLDSEDRQRKQATLMVYRDALQAHYHDMSGLAETLNAQLQKGEPVAAVLDTNPTIIALREHTKHTTLWMKIEKWNTHLQKIQGPEKLVQDQIKDKIENDHRLRTLFPDNQKQMIYSFAAALISQFRRWMRESPPFNPVKNYFIESLEGGSAALRYNAYRFDFKTREDAEALQQIVAEYEAIIRQWPEATEIMDLLKDKDKLQNDLSEELSYSIYRRVFPGKCRYCPW
ncbi:MAG: hypothetical protein Q7T57_02510 [Dehalococcoidales bacterium]|nr:hypothetical protein [Dehalococcoidales bacterium]